VSDEQGIPSGPLQGKVWEAAKADVSPFDYAADRLKCIAAAEESGLIVMRPDKTQLFLDLDTPAQMQQYESKREMVGRFFDFRETDRWVSKSGQGHHVVLTGPDGFSVEARIALQAALGSDPAKELLSIKRVKEGLIDPVLLFRPGKPVEYRPEPSPLDYAF
jgi:hypothetical protein